MNQLFLKDLADKTRRGLRGRVEAGLSGGGNSYGYDVVRRHGTDGLPVTGERVINRFEADVIRRIFKEFAEGRSPKAIARTLNADGIPGPRGEMWRDTAIRGHRARCTGLINNELYIGRLVWNRLRYVKDPQTGKRVSRLNPPDAWTLTEVPELRIVSDEQWFAVKKRQGTIDADPRVAKIKETRFWEHRRQTHLLTGLLRCGTCGGNLAAVGRDYVACSAARKLGTCSQKRSIRRAILDEVVLGLLKGRLMQPDAVAEFIAAYGAEMNGRRDEETAGRTRQVNERAQVARKLEGLYDAISEGLRTPGLKARLEELEARLSHLDAELAAPAPSAVRLHPNLSEMYRKKVTDLAAGLADPEIRTSAMDVIRGLITQITVIEGPDGMSLDLEGALSAVVDLAQNANNPPEGGLGGDRFFSSVKVVAGAGFEPAAFRL